MVENNYAFTYHNSIDINELGEEIGRFVTGPKKSGKYQFTTMIGLVA